MFLQLTLVRWSFQSCIMRWKCGPSKWPLLEIHHSSPNWPWERYLTLYWSTKHWSTKQTKDFFNIRVKFLWLPSFSSIVLASVSTPCMLLQWDYWRSCALLQRIRCLWRWPKCVTSYKRSYRLNQLGHFQRRIPLYSFCAGTFRRWWRSTLSTQSYGFLLSQSIVNKTFQLCICGHFQYLWLSHHSGASWSRIMGSAIRSASI
jgi:hypothetical protein